MPSRPLFRVFLAALLLGAQTIAQATVPQTTLAQAAPAPATPSQTRGSIDGSKPEDVLNIARGYGAATLGKDGEGDPQITGKIEGVSYSVYFYGCTQGAKCSRIVLSAAWTGTGVTLEQVNEWNRRKLFGKAYLDKDRDPTVDMSVILSGGVSYAALDDAFDVWTAVLDAFVEEVVKAVPAAEPKG